MLQNDLMSCRVLICAVDIIKTKAYVKFKLLLFKPNTGGKWIDL